MLNSEQKVQECDARNDNSSNAAGPIFNFIKLINKLKNKKPPDLSGGFLIVLRSKGLNIVFYTVTIFFGSNWFSVVLPDIFGEGY